MLVGTSAASDAAAWQCCGSRTGVVKVVALPMAALLTVTEPRCTLQGLLSTVACLTSPMLQSALEAKAEVVQELLQLLGGWESKALGACLEPHAAASLMYLEAGAARGERKGVFTVRRAAALWDALPQAQEQHLLSAAPTGSKGKGGPGPVKLFPSFVDEYAGGGKSKLVVEAGEGHGPRKEFFVLAGADMTGAQPNLRQSVDMHKQSGGGLVSGGAMGSARPHGKPALFSYNRTAGCYWYNSTLAQVSSGAGMYVL